MQKLGSNFVLGLFVLCFLLHHHVDVLKRNEKTKNNKKAAKVPVLLESTNPEQTPVPAVETH